MLRELPVRVKALGYALQLTPPIGRAFEHHAVGQIGDAFAAQEASLIVRFALNGSILRVVHGLAVELSIDVIQLCRWLFVRVEEGRRAEQLAARVREDRKRRASYGHPRRAMQQAVDQGAFDTRVAALHRRVLWLAHA